MGAKEHTTAIRWNNSLTKAHVLETPVTVTVRKTCSFRSWNYTWSMVRGAQ